MSSAISVCHSVYSHWSHVSITWDFMLRDFPTMVTKTGDLFKPLHPSLILTFGVYCIKYGW